MIRALGKPDLCKPFEGGVAVHTPSLGTGRTSALLRETAIIRSMPEEEPGSLAPGKPRQETPTTVSGGETQQEMPDPRSRVFISYVRDDAVVVDRLAAALRKARLHPWVDRKDLAGGQRWKAAIRKAIQEGAGAVVCFSSHYSARQKTYMNEELTLMIEELRQRPTDKSWFIPVRLDDCTITDRSIGAGETLHDLQRIDLFPDWDDGVRRIVKALRPPPFVKLL